MDFTRIFKMQRALDQAILQAHGITNSQETNQKRIVALLVEIGEFANEYAPFKYWKKNKTVNRTALLEEFIDGIHFLASLALDQHLEPLIHSQIVDPNQTGQLLAVFSAVAKLHERCNAETVRHAFSLYLGLARQLAITNTEIEKHYVNKNQVNYERIATNY